MQETQFQFLGQEDPLEKKMATHSSIPGLPCGSAGKESACNAGDLGLIPGLGRSPGRGHGNTLQECLENSMHRGVWWATVHGVAKSRTQLDKWNELTAIGRMLWTQVINVFQNETEKDISLTWKIRRVYSNYVCVCKFVCVCVCDGERDGDGWTDSMMEQFDRKCFFL